jgi:hypothetical protein
MIAVGFAPKAEELKPDKLAPLMDIVMVTPLSVAPDESLIVVAFVNVPPVLGRLPNAFQTSPVVPTTAGPVGDVKAPVAGLTLMRFWAELVSNDSDNIAPNASRVKMCLIEKKFISLP